MLQAAPHDAAVTGEGTHRGQRLEFGRQVRGDVGRGRNGARGPVPDVVQRARVAYIGALLRGDEVGEAAVAKRVEA